VRVGWTPLPEPRRLTTAEQLALDRLVAYANCAELAAQAASARATATCDCGCRSVRLHTDAAALSRTDMLRLSSTGRDDWFSIDCTRVEEASTVDGPTSTGVLQVVVHVVDGSLHELEIFAGDGVVVDVPSPEELNNLDLI
jgi:hypothetical protein